jgi:hypothetical protein
MSIFTTKWITRDQAEDMVRKIRARRAGPDDISTMSLKDLEDELDMYVYENAYYPNPGKYSDIVGCAYNYIIQD